jgi:hypothetical protein
LTRLDRSCRTAAAASAGNDTEIQRLQQALRDERTPSRAAEQLGYRFITRRQSTRPIQLRSCCAATCSIRCTASARPN